MDYHITSIPVVLLVFNRPDHTRQMFEAVRQAQPPMLFIVADGPRNENEQVVCEEVRTIVEDVDWACDVHKNYADQNMGLKARISSGLDWVFEQTEMAIILEDDCIPNPDFFRYCETLLHHYRDDERVMHISGDNFGYQPANDESYYFSKYAHVWGWATWRRAWQLYDVDMRFWEDSEARDRIMSRLGNRFVQNYWYRSLRSTYRGNISTWDYQWAATCLLHGGLCTMPATNLITNIGAGEGATNTTVADSYFMDLKAQPLAFPLKHASNHAYESKADGLMIGITLIENTRWGRRIDRLFRLLGIRVKKLIVFYSNWK